MLMTMMQEKGETKSKTCRSIIIVRWATFIVLDQFKDVLQKQATIEAITEWLDTIIDQHVLRVRRYLKSNKNL